MSRDGRSEQMALLRAQIARIEGNGSAAVSFGSGRVGKTAFGQDFDRLLGEGLQRGRLTEIVAGRPGDAAAASGFALSLAARFARTAGAPVVWIIEDGAGRERGRPYAPGLAAHGLDPNRLVIVHAVGGAEALWATEEALKCRTVAAVATDLWSTRAYDLVASRRLVLAAGRSGTPGLLVPQIAGIADALSSAAQVRFEVRAAPSPRLPSAGTSLPLPGQAAFDVRLARIRAGPAGLVSFDRERFWPLVWDHEEARLRNAFPVPAPAVSRDGSHSAPAYGRNAA